MDINLTLIGQALTFGIFVWFTMKFVWPPIVKVMRERQQQIADGLAAAEKGSRDLEEAQMKAEGIISEAKANAAAIMDGANSRANATIEESKQRAREEGERLMKAAEDDISQQYTAARLKLRDEIADLTLASTRKVLDSAANADINKQLVDQLLGEM